MAANFMRGESVDNVSSDLVERVTEAAIAIQTNGGLNVGGLTSSRSELESIGINIENPKTLEKYCNIGKQEITSMFDKNTKVSLAAPLPTDSVIGTNTFELSNVLIQDISPEASLENSPYEVMLPTRNIEGIEYQQDIMSSFYGWADGDNGALGAINAVPLLETQSNAWKGYAISEMSFLSGKPLIELREVGTSDAVRRGALQKLNYGMLNLLQRHSTGLELNRIEALYKGSWTWQGLNQATPVTIGVGIPASNIGQYVDNTTPATPLGLGSYVTSTNTFTANAIRANPLVQLGQFITQIRNMGMEIEAITMDNIVYGAIFNSSPIANQTQYVAMNSSNDVMGVRRNLFRITTIPDLQGIDIMVDNRAVKINSDTTTTRNTRPLIWGKTVSSSSFRSLILVRPKGLSRVGDFGFFPNLYARTTSIQGGTRSMGGFGGNIVMVTQDLSQFDIINQKVQLLTASATAPMVYLPNMVFAFDWNVTVS